MRLDKFLKVTQIFKRRAVAKEATDEGVMKVNSRIVKPSYVVKVGDILEVDMWNYYKKVEILKLPTAGSIPKPAMDEYIKILEYTPKG